MKQLALVVALGLVAAGCGGASHPTKLASSAATTIATSTAGIETTSTAGHAMSRSDLRMRVRSTLLANHRLAVRVLWTNRVPPNADRSTRGPALAEMRTSALGRERRGVRVRMLHDDYRIVSLVVDRSGRHATAVARSVQQVELTHLNGASLGKSVHLDERARIELHRVASSDGFVVWSISLVK